MNTTITTTHKKLFVVRVNNFRPDLCEYTIPTIKYWCELNGWQYNEINERMFPTMPITAEKLQVYNLGRLSLWNCICDADVILRPDMVDPSSWSDPNIVRSSYHFKAHEKFITNRYFDRDARDLGLSGGFVMASRMCHEVWEHPRSWLHALSQTPNKHLVDEYVLSTNLAKYGLHYDGVTDNVDHFIHHFGSELDPAFALAKARDVYLNLIGQWPSIANQSHAPL